MLVAAKAGGASASGVGREPRADSVVGVELVPRDGTSHSGRDRVQADKYNITQQQDSWPWGTGNLNAASGSSSHTQPTQLGQGKSLVSFQDQLGNGGRS